MGTYISMNVSMYDKNAGFQFLSTNDLDSGFVTTDGEFGICIIFMPVLELETKDCGIPAVLHRTGIVW